MKLVAIAVPGIFLLASCATIFNKKTTKLYITATEPDARAVIADSTYQLPAKVKVFRSNKDLNLRLITADTQRVFRIKPSPSPVFLLGNIVAGQYAPIAYGIDFTNQKRFDYGFKVNLDTKDSKSVYIPPIRDYFTKAFNYNSRTIRLNLLMPYVNQFAYRPYLTDYKNSIGFIGIGVGGDYFYKPSRFVSVEIATMMNFPVPFPASVHYGGAVIFFKSSHILIGTNYKLRRFSLGYGLALSRNNWELKYYGNTIINPNMIENQVISYNLGLNFPINYQLSKNFHFGINYRPALLQLAPKFGFNYEHLISLNLAWKFRISKGI